MNVECAMLAQIVAKLSPAKVTVVAVHSKPWASVTFSGARHELTLLAEGEGALIAVRRLQRTVTTDEFDIKGHLVADILVSNVCADAEGARLDIEALTVVLD